MRLIDADALIERIEADAEYMEPPIKTVTYAVIFDVKQAPTAVEIVRCRECKYFWTYRCMDSMPIETCELAQTFYNPDLDFCSLAKRREE